MKLVVLGLSASSSWGNGHATLWRGLLRALAAEGHEVSFFERDTHFYALHRDLERGEGWELVVYPTWDAVAERVRRAIDNADATIVTSYQADAPQAIEAVLEAPGLRVFYDLDTPVTLAALERGERVAYLPTNGLGDFDLVLSYTGGVALDALQARLGARHVAPLYGCVDLVAHHPSPARHEWACDLSYLGTYAADRQEAVERLFLDVAEQLPAATLMLGGPMYPAHIRRPPNVRLVSHVAPLDHPAFYGSSRLTLSLTRGAMAKMGYCPSARLFEAAACGVPILTDVWPGLAEFFEPGHDVIVARRTDDVVDALRAPRGALARVAWNARARVLADHGADQRARELVALLESVPLRGSTVPLSSTRATA